MNNQHRILIFTGGTLGEWALEEIRDDDLIVGVDRGALFLIRHQLQPDLAIGDFDSVTGAEAEEIRTNSKTYISCDPVMKDQTDTEMAFHWALQQRPAEIVLLGALGTRFDHTLSNVHLLSLGLRFHIPCRILDEKNELLLIDKPIQIERGRFTHVSLLPFGWEVTGITLDGFQYPLHDAALRIGDSLGISNVLLSDSGSISLKNGQLLVIKSMD
ncbi:thiamine diphosphokinase [Brevibacillus fulvus]|uniref:Thiamine diphosphokinase n=1 Tax=Brevibacillus fulvus TaxID=1125967 RepID=A0A939BS15_9BACL|nr:thiamine diphosphokinase [Brevibacillus fulvus]MBM7590237.1 thiamine pyrophosphokinase [Brevibacillus fulvus]